MLNLHITKYLGKLTTRILVVDFLLTFIKNCKGRNGGTWVCKEVAVHLAAWCCPAFAVQVDKWTVAIIEGDIEKIIPVVVQNHDEINGTSSTTGGL